MIMVLSCCDLLTVIVYHPLVAVLSIILMTEKLKHLPHWVSITLDATSYFHLTSVLALFVMNIDRYLAIFRPIYHKTKITKGRLLTILGIMLSINLVFMTLSIDELLYSMYTFGVFFIFFFMTPMVIINFKLLIMVAKKTPANDAKPKKKILILKHLSSCLLAFVSFMFFYFITVALSLYVVLVPKSKITVERFSALWIKTIATMNCTFNCLIFFWKNKLLRKEAMNFMGETKNILSKAHSS